MISSLCKVAEHQSCGVKLKLPSGKTFRCKCPCHAVVVQERRTFVVEEADAD